VSRRAAAALGLAALLAGCVPPATGPGGVSTLRGRAAVVGSAPMNTSVSFRAEDGRTVTLTGPLRQELGRLSGVELEVEGRMEGSELEATAYRVLSVDGRPAWVGVVERDAAGLLLRLEDGSAVRLGGGVSDLRPGQKVWVQGPTQLQVQTFGVIVP
jgi:hypothetical protein